jgi:flagellar protein FlgJ
MNVKDTSSWYDFGSLANLRAKAEKKPSEAQSSVASQFESLFLNLMLKEMRKTVSRSGLMGSEAMETYQQMFDQQIALGMSKAGGIGLAPFIESQLQRQDSVIVKPNTVVSTDVALQQRGFQVKSR